MQTAWKGVNKSLKDELISLRKNQIKWGLFFLLIKCGLFFLRSISKPSSSVGDMPGCRHNSTVTRNLEIRHETIVSVFHWHAVAQWTSQTGMDELYLNGRVDRMLLDINPIPSTKGRTTPLPFIAARHCYSILHMSCVPLMLAPFFFFFNWSDLRKLCLATICLHQCLRIIWHDPPVPPYHMAQSTILHKQLGSRLESVCTTF